MQLHLQTVVQVQCQFHYTNPRSPVETHKILKQRGVSGPKRGTDPED